MNKMTHVITIILDETGRGVTFLLGNDKPHLSDKEARIHAAIYLLDKGMYQDDFDVIVDSM